MVNSENVRRVVRKGDTVCVIEFTDGTALTARMTMDDWIANVAPQQSQVREA